MELWASGFNAWGQLEFEGMPEFQARDLMEFKCILRDERIEVLRTTLSATLVKTSAGLRIAGCSDTLIEHCISEQNGIPTLAVAGNDKAASQYFPRHPENQDLTEPVEVDLSKPNPSILKQYNSFESYLKNDGEEFAQCEGVAQVVANQCTFTALTKTGEVWTWGDGRYEACLGREISNEKPVATPCLVEDLLDLPTGSIRKIASGGYLTAALTEGNDLYVWGGRPSQPKLLEYLAGVPTPVDLNGEDLLDVAVGVSHILALTTEHKLFVDGNNSNGQLGLDVKELGAWKQISLPLRENQQISSVHVGYKNSLVIVEDTT